jgi:5-methylcytosine-specific restriction protein A
MSYAPKRPKITKLIRARIFEREGGKCYLCGEKIIGEWDADHELARELGGSDGEENLRPAHKDCHRTKSKSDVKAIAKSNRIVRKHGPVEERKVKPKIPRPANGGWSKGKTIWPKRPFGS